MPLRRTQQSSPETQYVIVIDARESALYEVQRALRQDTEGHWTPLEAATMEGLAQRLSYPQPESLPRVVLRTRGFGEEAQFALLQVTAQGLSYEQMLDQLQNVGK